MTLPPLANLFAVHDEDPATLAAIEADLEASGEFAEVWRPAAGWVAAAAPLPRGEPDGRDVRAAGLAFAEGRDVVGQDFGAVAQLADHTPERLASVPGDFGFIHFRPHGGATVVRSCGGLVPFYLWRSDGRTGVATRLGDFVRYLPEELALDPLVNAIWASGRTLFPNGRTFLAGVHIIARGVFAKLERGGRCGARSYWDPRPSYLAPPTASCAREHAERLRALLVHKLTRDLDPEGGNLLTLSGGVDSSSLAALAVGMLGRKVWTWTLLPDQEDEFQREMSYVAPLVSQFHIERTWSLRVRERTRVELLYAAPQVAFHVMHPALCALPGIVREAPVRVLFSGEFADEVCGSDHTWPDWAVDVSVPQLLAGVGRRRSVRDGLRWTKRRLLSVMGRPTLPWPEHLAGFTRPELQEEYRDWLDGRRRAAARDRAPRRYLALRAEEDGFVTMNWEAASALAVRRSFPFFNREVLELAFECHPIELVTPGTKKLLRAAVRNDVPAWNLDRPDKGHWGAYLRAVRIPWDTPLPEVFETVLRPEWCPRPPKLLDVWEASALAQLLVFLNSLRTRRRERRLTAADTPGMFRPNEGVPHR